MYEGLKPCFADVDEYLCMDPVDAEKKINEKTRAIAFVGYGGRVGQLDKIIEICKKHDLRLILDAAHMAGTRVNGVFPGCWDGVDVTVYSFQAVKNLPTGDSGMICFADESMDKECRMVSWMGINKDTYSRTSNEGTYKWNYGVDYLGFKYNGNAIMAGIALAQLPYLDEENARRREICAIYDKAFAGNPNIRIIPAPPDECAFHIYEIVVPDREALLAELAKHDIYAGVHYRDNTEFSMYTYAQGTCPVAHEVTQHIITMPLHMYLSDEDVQRIADIGICVLMACTVGTYGAELFGFLAKYLGASYSAVLIHICVYLVLLFVFTGMKPLYFLKKALPLMATTLSTSSSLACVPVNLQCADELDVSRKVSGFTIPLGSQINKDGNGIMLAITFLFAAQCAGADTSLATLLRVILISLILTTGAGGVPGGGIVSIAIVVDAFGLPLEVVALVSGIFTLIDVVYTTMNCLGDLVGTVIVDRSEKKRAERIGSAQK